MAMIRKTGKAIGKTLKAPVDLVRQISGNEDIDFGESLEDAVESGLDAVGSILTLGMFDDD